MISTLQFVTLLVAPLAVLACEGECIVNITKQFLKVYYPVTIDVFQTMADMINAQIVPPANRREDAISYFTPILDAYADVSYDGLEHAIFPAYFHGKCLYANGTVPDGCPNPDCPVVCGTPGSMVHFYPVLRRIVFNEVSGLLKNLTSPKSKAYHKVEKMVLVDALKTQRRTLARKPTSTRSRARKTTAKEKQFRTIMEDLPTLLLTACGGRNLSQCSWRSSMQKLILQFP